MWWWCLGTSALLSSIQLGVGGSPRRAAGGGGRVQEGASRGPCRGACSSVAQVLMLDVCSLDEVQARTRVDCLDELSSRVALRGKEKAGVLKRGVQEELDPRRLSETSLKKAFQNTPLRALFPASLHRTQHIHPSHSPAIEKERKRKGGLSRKGRGGPSNAPRDASGTAARHPLLLLKQAAAMARQPIDKLLDGELR